MIMNRIFVKIEKLPRWIGILILIIYYVFIISISISVIIVIINLIIYSTMGSTFLI